MENLLKILEVKIDKYLSDLQSLLKISNKKFTYFTDSVFLNGLKTVIKTSYTIQSVYDFLNETIDSLSPNVHKGLVKFLNELQYDCFVWELNNGVVYFDDVNLSKEFELKTIEIQNTIFHNCYFNPNFISCTFENVTFVNCNLKTSIFENCIMINVKYESCSLCGVQLKDCTIENITFENCYYYGNEIIGLTNNDFKLKNN